MSAELTQAISDVLQRLAHLAVNDPALRGGLRRLAEVVLAATANGEAGVSVPQAEPIPSAPESPAPPPPAAQAEPPQTVLAVRAKEDEHPAGAASAPPEPAPAPEPSHAVWIPRWAPVADTDLPLIAERCRLKAEAARWAAERRRRLREGANFVTEIEPRDRDIIERAKNLPDCFLWMSHPDGPSSENDAHYETAAGCFENQADALGLVIEALGACEVRADEFEQSLDLLAEAQSALRAAVLRFDGYTDPDQTHVFRWLRATASNHQVFLRRFMRSDDPADPDRWGDLARRIDEAAGRQEEARKRARERKKLLGNVRHKASLLARDPANAAEHARLLADLVHRLCCDGLPPSNRELRELLLPVIDILPELGEVPRGFELVLREIDRYLASLPPADVPLASEGAAAEVREVAGLVGGRSAVLIGGERRPAAHEALRRAFGLRELLWLESKEHQSIERFEPYIARADVAVVLLAIRWSSHSFGDVKQFCDRHGKPLVRLPAGYNPNQVALQLLTQCSDRLKTA